MQTKAAGSTVFEVFLDKDNYGDWSVRLKSYLMAQDLWDIVESAAEPPKQEDDYPAHKDWSKKNSTALQVILNSCGPDTFSGIKEISSAKIAWDTLAQKYIEPKNINSGRDNNNRNNDYVEYVALIKAVQSGNWNTSNEFLKLQPNAVNSKITHFGKTALHIAVAAGYLQIVEELVQLMSKESLEIQDTLGYTALAETTFVGNYRMAECMLRKNKNLVSIPDKLDRIPVVLALRYGYIDLARYLYSVTPLEDLMPEKGISGASLCTQAIYTRTLDIALHLIQRYRPLALAQDKDKISPLYALASVPYAFPSGNQLVFWKRWIYSSIHIESARAIDEIRLDIQKVEKRQSDQVKPIASAIDEGVKNLYEMKLVHVQSHELLCLMCEEISISNDEQRRTLGVYSAIFRAIKEGNFEFVYDIVRGNPDLVWCFDDEGRTIFQCAVLYRQAKIFSLLYGLHLKNPMVYTRDESHNNILHMVGMSVASTQLSHIAGAALQMQRELQWFKEVESIVFPKAREALNKDSLTPRELFTNNHKDLMKEGEQWMKGTATSCTVVGALITTVMFAAAFTVPGGTNQNTGLPTYINEKLFTLFIVTDSLSLFSSSTSVLMFLGILTSRYAEEDFLKSLPTKMIIGLSTLFFSIATMMIAFCAALLVMLRGQSWIVLPITCLASVPVTLFVLMQFPLLVDMLISTYGSGIFYRKMKRWF